MKEYLCFILKIKKFVANDINKILPRPLQSSMMHDNVETNNTLFKFTVHMSNSLLVVFCLLYMVRIIINSCDLRSKSLAFVFVMMVKKSLKFL